MERRFSLEHLKPRRYRIESVSAHKLKTPQPCYYSLLTHKSFIWLLPYLTYSLKQFNIMKNVLFDRLQEVLLDSSITGNLKQGKYGALIIELDNLEQWSEDKAKEIAETVGVHPEDYYIRPNGWIGEYKYIDKF